MAFIAIEPHDRQPPRIRCTVAMSTRSLKRLLYGTVAAYFAACAIAWPYLPERTPLHFTLTGQVTSWIPASPVLWFLMPVLGLGIIALALAASAPPEAWNLSIGDLNRFRALPADLQMQIRETVERSLLQTLLLFVATFASLQVGVFATAIRQSDQMPDYATAGMLLSVLGAILVGYRGQRRLRSQILAGATHRARPCER